jgi:hypothetical protein
MIETWFTPATARRVLPNLRPTAETLYRLFVEMESRRPDPAADSRVDPLYFTMLEALLRGLGRLRRAGLRVDDLRHGMLDFPALRGGRPVLLCWRVGEASLDFWREPGDRDSRLPVDDGGPWEAPPDRCGTVC